MAEKLDASVRLEENQLFVSGPVTYGSVVKITQAGLSSMNHRDLVIDLAEITEVDSSAVSMLLEWLRAAHVRNFQLRFVNLPENLVSLIQLYDVIDLIPVNSHNQI
jgi:phospholipid transport system transporter-binding protein